MENNKLKEAMEKKEYVEKEITDEKAIEKYWSIVSDSDSNKPEKYKYTKPKTLQNKVFEALGEVSMCWSETPKGVFDSTNAERIGNELMKEIEKYINNKTK